jgi:hypothetical protein
LRGDGAVEDVDEDWPPKDERGVGDDDGCYLLSLRWFSLEEERVMQQSR